MTQYGVHYFLFWVLFYNVRTYIPYFHNYDPLSLRGQFLYKYFSIPITRIDFKKTNCVFFFLWSVCVKYLFPQFLKCHGVNLLFDDILKWYLVMSDSNLVPVLIVDMILFQCLLVLLVLVQIGNIWTYLEWVCRVCISGTFYSLRLQMWYNRLYPSWSD